MNKPYLTLLAAILALSAAGCAGSSAAPRPSGAVAPSPVQSSARPALALPSPDAAIPKNPARLATALVSTSKRLRQAVDDWVKQGDPAEGQAPDAVVRLALHQQRIYRFMAHNPGVAGTTYARLPKALADQAKDNVTAISGLLSLAHPISGPVKLRLQPPAPADVLLGHFRRAERRFGVEWEVLAAVMFVETKFGRVRSPSYTGAQGPMQFMPGTWKLYGMGGDVHDTRDSLLAAANYLHASGAPGDYRRALYAYNHSTAYVDAVLRHARQMKRDIRNFYGYYNWQVYVLTTHGERRLTGP